MNAPITQPQWLIEHKAMMLAHYIQLSQMKGCEEYAAQRIDDLDKHPSGLYRGIKKRIEAEIANKGTKSDSNI